ncbi:MAG: hypothetical protein WAM28_02450 [Chlamydiales bacterium]
MNIARQIAPIDARVVSATITTFLNLDVELHEPWLMETGVTVLPDMFPFCTHREKD